MSSRNARSVTGSLRSEFPSVESVFANLPKPLDEFERGLLPGPPKLFVPPFSQSLFSEEQNKAPYDAYYLHTRYLWDESLAAMPRSGSAAGTGGENSIGVLPTPNARTARTAQKLARLSAPYGHVMAYWHVRRVKTKPVAPAPQMESDNAVLLGGELVLCLPVLLGDNSIVYMMEGSYLFALKKPVWFLDDVSPGLSPTNTLTTADGLVTSAQFTAAYEE